MPDCDVLRCKGGRDATLPVSGVGYPLMEVAVCAVHQAAIDAGAVWYYDSDQSQLFMDEDLSALRLHRVTDIEMVAQADRLSTEALPHERLRLELTDIAGRGSAIVDILLTEQSRADLQQFLR